MFKELRNKFLILNMSIFSVLMIAAFLVVYLVAYNNVQTENYNRLRMLSATPTSVSFILPPRIIPEEITGGGQIRIMPGDTEGNGLSRFFSGEVEVNHQIIRTVPHNYNFIEGSNEITRSVPHDYNLSFSIQVNAQGEVQVIRSLIDMPDQTYQEAASMAWRGNRDSAVIVVDGKRWLYQITSAGPAVSMSSNGRMGGENVRGENTQIAFLDVTDAHNTLFGLMMTFIMVGLVMLVCIFAVSAYFANRAIQPIAEAWDKQKRFVADASHELKTPIAIIAANADALLANSEETVNSQRKWIDYIQGETDRMGKLVNNLLSLAKTDDPVSDADFSPFDLSALINRVVLSMEAVAFEKGVTITRQIEPEVMLRSDPEKIEQVLKILLDNGVKYTDDDGHIDVTLKRVKGKPEFTVKNSGRGIPAGELPKIFDRFYCGDPARTRESGGYGLGLSIAKGIVDNLGGKIYAQSVENEYTAFVVTFKGLIPGK